MRVLTMHGFVLLESLFSVASGKGPGRVPRP
jgi:hypothetical protein